MGRNKGNICFKGVFGLCFRVVFGPKKYLNQPLATQKAAALVVFLGCTNAAVGGFVGKWACFF